MDPIRQMERLAARQEGVFSRAQALALGVTTRQLEHRVATGFLIRLDTGVFSMNSAPATWARQLRAAVLSRPIALAAGQSAAVLHEFPRFRPARTEILVPFAGNARSPLARVIRSRRFDLVDRVNIDGFETTSVAETILTLAARRPPSVIERLVDDRIAAKKLDIADFDPIFESLAYARVSGLPPLKRIARARDHKAYQPPTSELERRLYRLLDGEGIPTYTRQVPIGYPSLRAVVDAHIPDWNLIVEADGRRWHTREADFDKDRERDNAAAAAGLRVVRFTYRMLTKEPETCLQTLSQAGRWRVTA